MQEIIKLTDTIGSSKIKVYPSGESLFWKFKTIFRNNFKVLKLCNQLKEIVAINNKESTT